MSSALRVVWTSLPHTLFSAHTQADLMLNHRYGEMTEGRKEKQDLFRFKIRQLLPLNR